MQPPVDHVSMVLPRATIEAVDDWRSRQRPLPSRAAALRLLIERALAADGLPVPAPPAPPRKR
jgi:hypothetical protein